jgi:hypothetical protein
MMIRSPDPPRAVRADPRRDGVPALRAGVVLGLDAARAVDFFAVDFFAVDFFAVDFFAVAFFAVDFFAVDFVAVDFFAGIVSSPARSILALVPLITSLKLASGKGRSEARSGFRARR